MACKEGGFEIEEDQHHGRVALKTSIDAQKKS